MVYLVSDADWWRQAVIYQIYPRSFADANGDGIGDLKGITSRVPYLKDLGIDAVWLSPFYPSALKDGGYDVADYRNVDPKIGTLEDFDEMSSKLKEAGIKVMVDIVPNHSSDDHEWFQAALKAGKGSPERERYIFKDGLGPNKEKPPTDWLSLFGGSSWTSSGQNDGQFYFHWYDSSQPDFNWDNLEIQQDFLRTLKFWADKGVSGFRIDVAHGLSKSKNLIYNNNKGETKITNLPNYKELEELTTKKLKNGLGNSDLDHPLLDRDEVHHIYKDWRKLFNTYDPPLMAVAEAWVAPDRKGLYASPDGLGQTFSFDMLLCNFDPDEYRECINSSLEESKNTGSSTTWVLSNHDVMRHASRFGLPNIPTANLGVAIEALNPFLKNRFTEPKVDIESGLNRAKAATLMILALPGSTYIYQGEELGLQEVVEIDSSERQDPIFSRTKGEMIGRDGCRVPIPWSSKSSNFGFGDGTRAHLPQPKWFERYAVDLEENNQQSTLNIYRKALKLRKELQCPENQFKWIETSSTNKEILHFKRSDEWEIIVNTSKKEVELPKGKQVLISSSGKDLKDGLIPGETTVWLK